MRPYSPAVLRTLETKIIRTRRALRLERAVRAFWPLWPIAALIGAVVLSGVWRAASAPVLVGAVVAAAGAIAWALWRGARRYRSPTRREAIWILDAELARRPVSALNDRLADDGDPRALKLWKAHQIEMIRRVRAARAPAADLGLAAEDPANLRYVAILALFVGFMAHRADLGSALIERLDGPPPPAPTLEAWAAPPAYTGAAPIYLTATDAARVVLPAGSVITAQIANATASAQAVFNGPDAVETALEDGAFSASFTLTGDGVFSVAAAPGQELGAWRFAASPDAAPTLRLTDGPRAGARGALTFAYEIEDDYGVQSASAEVILDPAPDPAAHPAGDPISFDAPAGYGAAQVQEKVLEDLADHPWAGQSARLRLTAVDGAGQTAAIVSDVFVMPERIFSEPMAKALIEQRRILAADIRDALDVSEMLDAVSAYPDSYFRRLSTGLTVSMAKHRLAYALEERRELAVRDGVMGLLWSAAGTLEEGNLDNLREQYMRAQERLNEAIRQGAPQEELDRLMEEMRQALRDYMRALAEQAQNQPTDQAQQGESVEITQNDLDELMRQLEEALEEGDTERAQELMAMLDEMTRNLQMSQGQGQGEGFNMGQSGQSQPGEEEMNDLQDLMRRQQDLADETFRRGQNGENDPQQGQEGQEGAQDAPQPGEEGQEGRGSDSLANRQEGLRQGLEDLMRGLPDGAQGEQPGPGEQAGEQAEGEEPRPSPGERAEQQLNEAGEAMDEAADALRQGQTGDAVEEQLRALEGMREGLRALGEAMQQDRAGGEQPGEEGDGQANAEDPMGRPSGRGGANQEGDAPEASARSRARDLEQELRRRSGERDRPQYELDYLERLMRRFQ